MRVFRSWDSPSGAVQVGPGGVQILGRLEI